MSGPPARVRWRGLAWVTWRQHRAALLGAGLAFAILAIALLVTGVLAHEAMGRWGSPWQYWAQYGHHYVLARSAFTLLLLLAPVLAGLFLGAPLLAREAENGTVRLAWTQAASRTRWLAAQVVPVACLLALAGLGIGAEFRWWAGPLVIRARSWSPEFFTLNPLPMAGWALLAFTLGLALGAAIRRTLPAMAATLACYGTLLYQASFSWRPRYLAPLHRAFSVQFQGGGGYSYGVAWASPNGPGPDIISADLGWPDGRLLGGAQIARHSAAWLRLHHIELWATYQPGSRYLTFQLVEFCWLTVLSVILVAGTVILIRRRSA